MNERATCRHRTGTDFKVATRHLDSNSSAMNGRDRKDIKPGLRVGIVLKQDQRRRKMTYGIGKDILMKSSHHRHRIKVRLETGEVDRVKEIEA
jgi:uncharacterized repeat protein (TIGR03833 family)